MINHQLTDRQTEENIVTSSVINLWKEQVVMPIVDKICCVNHHKWLGGWMIFFLLKRFFKIIAFYIENCGQLVLL